MNLFRGDAEELGQCHQFLSHCEVSSKRFDLDAAARRTIPCVEEHMALLAPRIQSWRWLLRRHKPRAEVGIALQRIAP
jgi:hypothetical protein